MGVERHAAWVVVDAMTDDKDGSCPAFDPHMQEPAMLLHVPPTLPASGFGPISFGKVSIRDLCVCGRTYRPQPDITVTELAAMFRLFMAAMIPSDWDFEEFIVREGLERHWPKDEAYSKFSGVWR